MLVVGLVAIGLGLFLPVLGVSLIVFLLADAAWLHVRSRRAVTASGAAGD